MTWLQGQLALEELCALAAPRGCLAAAPRAEAGLQRQGRAVPLPSLPATSPLEACFGLTVTPQHDLWWHPMSQAVWAGAEPAVTQGAKGKGWKLAASPPPGTRGSLCMHPALSRDVAVVPGCRLGSPKPPPPGVRLPVSQDCTGTRALQPRASSQGCWKLSAASHSPAWSSSVGSSLWAVMLAQPPRMRVA